ncbi:MAG: hypothetical protein ACMUIG_02885 [Thermoplasmatota archaeon]
MNIDTAIDVICEWSIWKTDLNGSKELGPINVNLLPYSYPILSFEPSYFEGSVGEWISGKIEIWNQGNDRGTFTIVNITPPEGIEYRLPQNTIEIDERAKGYLYLSVIQIGGTGRMNQIEMILIGTVGNDTKEFSNSLYFETKYTPASFFLSWYFPVGLLIMIVVIAAAPTFYRRTLGKARLMDPFYS